ncbi:hypothetical protein AB0G05_29380 [Nonomuraea wenchangensis]
MTTSYGTPLYRYIHQGPAERPARELAKRLASLIPTPPNKLIGHHIERLNTATIAACHEMTTLATRPGSPPLSRTTTDC